MGPPGLRELSELPCDYSSVLCLHTVLSFDIDLYLKGTDGICLSDNHLKGKIGSVELWTLSPYFKPIT